MLISLLLGACGWITDSDQAVQVTAGPEVAEEAWHPIVTEIIADGQVTSAELTVAYEAYIECMEAAGMLGKYTYDVEVIGPGVPKQYGMPGDEDGELTGRVENRCYARIVAPVEDLYTDPLTWPERKAVRRESIIDCLAEVDPTWSTIPDSVSLTSPDSPIYEEALRSGGNEAPTVQCIETLGVGWSEFQPVE